MRKPLHLAAVAVASLAAACASARAQAPAVDIAVDGDRVFPESVTSTSDGRVIVGSVFGAVYRTEPGGTTATKWIEIETSDGGDAAVFGVLADERSNLLWACTSGNPWGETPTADPVALRTFDLASGAAKSAYPFPPRESGASVCNDVTIGADGSAYAADTQGARILRLPYGSPQLEVWAEDPELGGVDGIAFSEDGTLYVNTVTTGLILRIGIEPDGSAGAITRIAVPESLGGPDGMRLIDGDRFLLAEGQAGRLSILDIEGDAATMTVLKDDLVSSPGATAVGDTAYVIESQIGYLIDPNLRGQQPGPFVVYAVPLNGR
jgi:sugar lactone lactonase YvrE